MNNSHEEQTYTPIERYEPISDFGSMCALSALGFTPESSECAEDGRVNLHFQKSNELNEAIRSYFQRTLRIEPQQYEFHRKAVASLIRNAKK